MIPGDLISSSKPTRSIEVVSTNQTESSVDTDIEHTFVLQTRLQEYEEGTALKTLANSHSK